MLRSTIELKRLVGVGRDAEWWPKVAWGCELDSRGSKCRYKRHKNNDAGAEDGSNLRGSEKEHKKNKIKRK